MKFFENFCYIYAEYRRKSGMILHLKLFDYSMNCESGLVERIKGGDRIAFDELYKQHYFPLRAYARLLLYDEEAEDMVQDVFLSLWINRERLDSSLSIRKYLLRSVYNASVNVVRKRNLQESYMTLHRRNIEEIGLRQYFTPDINDTIASILNKELRVELDKAIDALPPRCREVFMHSFVYGFTGRETGEKLGLSLSTVENHINIALRVLRHKLIRHKYELLVLLIIPFS